MIDKARLLAAIGLFSFLIAASSDSYAKPDGCPTPCEALAVDSSSGAWNHNDGLLAITVTNLTNGWATLECEATCDQCAVEFIFNWVPWNPGTFCLESALPSGSYPIGTAAYSRPGVLKSNCNPDFAPFITATITNCTTGAFVHWEQLTLVCGC